MSATSHTLAEFVATFVGTVSAGVCVAWVTHAFTKSREKCAERRKREAEERARSEAAKTIPAGVPSGLSCIVVTTGVQQNVQVNFLTINQQIIIRPPRDDEQDLSP